MEKVEDERFIFMEKQKILLHMADILWENQQISEKEKNQLKNMIQKLKPQSVRG